jgi:sugar lactone lactonase YvrE
MFLKRFVILLVLFSFSHLHAQKKVSVAFTLTEKDLIPEGITYDAVDQSFYVGSINKHKVVKISAKGVVRDFISSGQDGVGEVLGMKVDSKRHLWFCSVSPKGSTITPTVFEYDIASGKLIRKYELNAPGETQQLNDLQFLNDAVYVTDSFEGAVYKIDGDKIELFVKSDLFRYSNGITTTPDGQKLLVSTGTGIVQLDPATKDATRLSAPFYIIGVDTTTKTR